MASSRQIGLSGRPDASTNQNSNPDAASSFQVWQRDAQLFFSTGKPVAMVTTEHQGCSGKSKIPEDSGDSKPKSRIWPHHFSISPDCVPHMEKVFSIVRKIYDRKPTDDMKYLDVNTAIWSTFMSVTLQAAVHLGPDCSMQNCDPSKINLRSLWSNSSRQLRS